MISLVLATAFFVSLHLFVSGTALRDRLTDQIGEKVYLGAFSLASLVGLVWMCWAFSSAPYVHLWMNSVAVKHLAASITIPIAFLLAVVGITTPSPTTMGGEGLLDGEEPAKGILRITRHPLLWGVAIWAATHLVANGDAASLVFFGGLLALSLAGPPSIDAKRARRLGGKWESFAQATSSIPFAAILAGRNRLVLREIALWRVVAAAVAFGVMFLAHGRLFGSVFG